MRESRGPFQAWERATRMPHPSPPGGSCDCQFHIYGDPAEYPTRPSPPYPPIDASFEDSRTMHRALGFDHGVIVHSAIYGTDHRLLLDVLESLPDRDHYRGTANLDESVSDAEVARLSAAGVDAARINFVKFLTMTPGQNALERTFDRIREIGWRARLHVSGDDLLEHSRFLRSRKDVVMMVEHMGHLDFEKGLDQPACKFILEILKNNEDWWLLASNGNRDSRLDTDWDDAVPFGAALIAAAPDRTVWGTDWPHPQWSKPMMNDADTVELLYRYVDRDPSLIQKILVENPARLYGFPKAERRAPATPGSPRAADGQA